MNTALRAALKRVVPPRVRPQLRTLFYAGARYRCPLCEAHLRCFLPAGLPFAVLKEKEIVGGGYCPNVLCPLCFCVDRERLLYLYLKNKTDLFERRRKILHVAPEGGISKRLARYGDDYVTADLYGQGVKVKMDVTNIQVPDASFDVILCNHVLEHIPDDGRAMRELHRVLKPGGWGILQVPISLSLTSTYEDPTIVTAAAREQAFGQSDHVRIYARDYTERLEGAGFKVEVYRWTNERHLYGGGGRNVFSLNEKEEIFRIARTT